jgi:hypothetical protein
MAELVALKTKTRGRNSRELEYQGLGKQAEDGSVDTRGAVSSIDEAILLTGGNEQKVWDLFAIGYNYDVRQAVLDTDEFSGLLDDVDWAAVAAASKLQDDEKQGTAVEQALSSFKRSVRATIKSTGADIDVVVQLLKGLLKK